MYLLFQDQSKRSVARTERAVDISRFQDDVSVCAQLVAEGIAEEKDLEFLVKEGLELVGSFSGAAPFTMEEGGETILGLGLNVRPLSACLTDIFCLLQCKNFAIR
jgi:hypothetical protein